MNEETIVAIYDTAAHAGAAVQALRAANVPESAITQHASSATTSGTAAAEPRQGFWGSLFGGEPDRDPGVYDRSIQGGSTVVTVRVPAQYYDQVSQILETHNPIDIDERATQYGMSGTRMQAAPVADTAATTSDGVIQLAEESIVVGKRAVNRGTTRVHRYVVEMPVQEQVTLRDEKVTIQRRPVAAGSSAVGDSFSDKIIEVTEVGEEAVVGKTAHVKEEVVIKKEAVDHVETVRDTVRREEVEIQKVPGTQTGTAGTTSPTRKI